MPRGNARKSPIWEFFATSLVDPTAATCLQCNCTLSRGTQVKNLTTTPLIKHLEKRHPENYATYVAQKTQSSDAADKHPKKTNETKQASVNQRYRAYDIYYISLI